jgi:hypothetical protein
MTPINRSRALAQDFYVREKEKKKSKTFIRASSPSSFSYCPKGTSMSKEDG